MRAAEESTSGVWLNLGPIANRLSVLRVFFLLTHCGFEQLCSLLRYSAMDPMQQRSALVEYIRKIRAGTFNLEARKEN